MTTWTNALDGSVIWTGADEVDAEGTLGGATVIATDSTQARTLSDRSADTVNVRDFGAVGDGGTNDRAAIVAARDAAVARGKRAVFFPDGVYGIGSGINFPADYALAFEGQSMAGVTVKALSGMTRMFAHSTGQVEGHAIRNMTLDGNLLAGEGIRLWRGKNAELHRLTIKRIAAGGIGIALGGGAPCLETRVSQCSMLFDASDYPAGRAACPQYGLFLASNATDNHVTDLVIKNVIAAGVRDEGATNAYDRVHVYGYPVTGGTDYTGQDYRPDYSFDMPSGYTSLFQVYCDGYVLGGIRLAGITNNIIGARFLINVTPNTAPAIILADGISRTIITGCIVDERIGSAPFVQFLGTQGNGVHINGNTHGDALRIRQSATPVNYAQIRASDAGSPVELSVEGTDSAISLDYVAKGTGSHRFRTAGGEQFRINNRNSAVNFLSARGGEATAAPAIVADGSDTNVDVTISPKGSGRVRFGFLTASGDAAITGYIEIRDAGGTTRRLAVIS